MSTIYIAIADDEAIQRQYMETLLEEVCCELSIHPIISTFESGEAFLFALEDHPEWQLAFLDIEMKGISGMEVAIQIRQRTNPLQIVFATAFAEYAVEGYRVDALDYLLKPITKEALLKVFKRYLSRQEITSHYLILQDIQGLSHRLELDEIISVEINGREISITTSDQEVRVRSSLADFKQRLDSRFVSPHRSFLVNLNHINSISKDNLILSNQAQIPISRRMVKEVQQAFIEHYRKEVSYD